MASPSLANSYLKGSHYDQSGHYSRPEALGLDRLAGIYCNHSSVFNTYNATQRIAFEYQAISESAMHKLFEQKGIKRSPDDAWYLQMIFTDPEYQGKGNYSLKSTDKSY